MCLVSIITPTYNHGKYLEVCVNSVISQTYQNWELIIVNDGSTDNSKNIINKFVKDDSRIKCINQTNVGLKNLGITYNKALEMCSGKYISILEGDDYWAPEKLEFYVNVMESENSIMGFGICNTVDEQNNVIDYYPRKYIWDKVNVNNNPIGSFLNIYLIKSFVPTPTLMFRSNELKEIGGFKQPNGMKVVDYPTILSFTLLGSFSFIKDKLAYYRIHTNQATAGNALGAASAGKYALHFYESLNSKMKNQLTISHKELKKNIEIREHLNYFHRGRVLLINQKYSEARHFFLKLIRSKSLSIKLRGIIGLFGTLMKINSIEKVARLTGRRRLS